MRRSTPKKIDLFIILHLLIVSLSAITIKNVYGQERVIKILSLADSNNITLGNETEPLPHEGIPFTVKIFLDGHTTNLMTFQVGIRFNSTFLNCTAAWIPKEDPSFVFYNKDFYSLGPSISEVGVLIGGVLKRPADAVTVDKGLLALLNFTAKKTGSTTIGFIPEPLVGSPLYTFLLDNMAMDISYSIETLSLTVVSQPPLPTPPIASFTFSPKLQKNIEFSHGDVNAIVNNPLNSTWSDGSKCVGWIDYDPSGLSISDILYMELADSNITWLVRKVKVDPSGWTVNLELWSWSELTVKFDASESKDLDGYIKSYYWDFGDNSTGEGVISYNTYERRGVYQASLTVVDNEDYNSSAVMYITVGYAPKAMLFTSPAGYPLEAILTNKDVTFNATDTFHPENVSIASYTWDFGDGNISTTHDPIITHTYAKRGIYICNLTVTDDNGISNFVTKEIFVGIPPTAHFTYSPPQPTTKDIIDFDATGSSGGGEHGEYPIVKYRWEFDDGTIVETNGTSISHRFETPGIWNVTLTVYDVDGLRYSYTETIVVQEITQSTQASFSLYAIAAIVIILVLVVAVIIKKKRGAEEEALEI